MVLAMCLLNTHQLLFAQASTSFQGAGKYSEFLEDLHRMMIEPPPLVLGLAETKCFVDIDLNPHLPPSLVQVFWHHPFVESSNSELKIYVYLHYGLQRIH
jgi:hypothetical protein